MSLTSLLSFFGGIGLFLYGMSLMSTGLKNAAGDKLRTYLEKVTGKQGVAVLIGVFVTVLIQSSSDITHRHHPSEQCIRTECFPVQATPDKYDDREIRDEHPDPMSVFIPPAFHRSLPISRIYQSSPRSS